MGPLLAILTLMCAVAGFAIGRGKGRPGLGAALGLLLGLIGLLIIAFIPARRPDQMTGDPFQPGGHQSFGGYPPAGPDLGGSYGPGDYGPGIGSDRGGYGPQPYGYPSQAPAPSAMPPACWAPDPGGIHELRWWDGRGWTEHVSDQGVTSQDTTTGPMS